MVLLNRPDVGKEYGVITVPHDEQLGHVEGDKFGPFH
jgi:hypothetical protein